MIKIGFIVLVFVLSSCVDGINRIEAPKNLIERDKMVSILTDLVKLEAHIKSKYVAVNQFHKVMANSGDSLLTEYNISYEDFDASLSYYGSRQEEMQEMYSEALENLSQELSELQSAN